MHRYLLARTGPTPEQLRVDIPGRASDWTIALHSRGLHRLLVPVDSSLRALEALRYIAEELGQHVAGVHVVNVQNPVMTGDVSPLVDVRTITAIRVAAGQQIVALAREAFAGSGIRLTDEVAFGAPAETICRIAHERQCTGIVVARNGLGLHDLIAGSVTAKVLRLATVPVTIVNSRTSAVIMDQEANVAGEQEAPTRHTVAARARARSTTYSIPADVNLTQRRG